MATAKSKQTPDTSTKQYRITSGKYHRREDGVDKIYRTNDVVNLTLTEAAHMRSMIEAPAAAEVREELAAISTSSTTPANSPDEYSYLSTLDATDAIDVINGLETVGEVEAARQAEISGQNRKEVIAAADARLPEDE